MPFFVGCGRSGTTLVRSIFDGHPELAVSYESRFVPFVCKRRRRYERARGFDTTAFVDDLLNLPEINSRVDRWGISAEVLRGAVEAAGAQSLAEAVRAIYGQYAARNGKPRAGEKTPDHVLHMLTIADLLPEARFVHTVRDGRNVAVSMLDQSFGPRSAGALAEFWTTRVRTGRHSGQLLGRARYLEVRYESLVESPEPVVRSVCEFLELPFEPSMLRYFERYDGILAATGGESHHTRLASPLLAQARNWRTDLPAAQVAVFEAVAGQTLSDFGYPTVARGRPGLPTQVRAWRDQAQWRGRVAAHRLRRRPPAAAREWLRVHRRPFAEQR